MFTVTAAGAEYMLTEVGEKLRLVRSGGVVSAPIDVTVTVAGNAAELGKAMFPVTSSSRIRLVDHTPGSAPLLIVSWQLNTPSFIVPEEGTLLPHEAD
jgi:hypothetical protein